MVLFSVTLLGAGPQALQAFEAARDATPHNDAATADILAVRQVGDAYIKATFEADVATLRQVFDPGAVMNGFLGGELGLGSPEPFFDGLTNNPPMASTQSDFKGWIESIDVVGNAARMTIKETGYFNTFNFTDYMHLIKTDDGWKIISKTYTSH